MKTKNKTIAYLGPPGTFSHQAVLEYFPNHKSVSCVDLARTFEAVRKHKNIHALAPYENSQTGLIQNSFDYLLRNDLRVIRRFDLSIEHYVLSHASLKDIRTLYSHPQAIEQCRKWISKHLSKVDIHLTESSSRLASEIGSDSTFALIASRGAADLYGLPVRARGIQDAQDNMTRFWQVAQRSEFASTPHHDSVIVYFTVSHRPGSLIRVLQQFGYQNINITHLHSHPVQGMPWHYGFFVNAACSASDPHFKEVTAMSASLTEDWKVLGSYSSVGSAEAVRQRWWAVDRLSNQFQPNKKVLYFYLGVKPIVAKSPFRQQLTELRLLAALSVGKIKWQKNRQVLDVRREQEVVKHFNKMHSSKQDRAWFRHLVEQSRDVQERLIKALQKGDLPKDEIVELSIQDLRYYIDQIDFWASGEWD